jgi:hypothetical protein
MMMGFNLALRVLPYVGIAFAVWWIYSSGQAHEREKQELAALRTAKAQMQKRIELTDWLNTELGKDIEARQLRAEMLQNHVDAYERELLAADAEADRLGETLTKLQDELKKTQDAPIPPVPTIPPHARRAVCALSDADVKRLLAIE